MVSCYGAYLNLPWFPRDIPTFLYSKYAFLTLISMFFWIFDIYALRSNFDFSNKEKGGGLATNLLRFE
jgi:low temperature requirement protein LtrA